MSWIKNLFKSKATLVAEEKARQAERLDAIHRQLTAEANARIRRQRQQQLDEISRNARELASRNRMLANDRRRAQLADTYQPVVDTWPVSFNQPSTVTTVEPTRESFVSGGGGDFGGGGATSSWSDDSPSESCSRSSSSYTSDSSSSSSDSSSSDSSSSDSSSSCSSD